MKQKRAPLKIRILSDLHLEASFLKIKGDKDEVLVLAGDTYLFVEKLIFKEFLEALGQEFKAVILIAGNHEFYHSKFTSRFPLKLSPNIHYLHNNTVTVDDVTFIGSTLWTDYGESREDMDKALLYMNDFRYIKYRGKELTPDVCLREFKKSKEFILSELKARKGMKTVVVSHHAPSYESIAPKYRVPNSLNRAFYTPLERLIVDDGPDLWIHGHVHSAFDYKIGDTRVICNPRGYVRPYKIYGENWEFDPNFTVEL